MDRAAALEEAHREAALQNHRLSRPPRQVNHTGRCCGCGHAIEPRRLAADPTVSRCIGCQVSFENAHKRGCG
ncbi:MAG TPA: TraR/DksA C4-type zinc finger protein [Nevskiales bacterium]|nr:TraR/DksA C4-type zinc finger protein [Nevskiales bacterium]